MPQILINFDDEDLWDSYSKERIVLGEKYILIEETDGDETIFKAYKLENAPAENADVEDEWGYEKGEENDS